MRLISPEVIIVHFSKKNNHSYCLIKKSDSRKFEPLSSKQLTAWKVSKYGVFSDPYFSVFGLNTEIYGVNFHIQSEYGKILTKKKLRIWTLFTQWKNRNFWGHSEKNEAHNKTLGSYTVVKYGIVSHETILLCVNSHMLQWLQLKTEKLEKNCHSSTILQKLSNFVLT